MLKEIDMPAPEKPRHVLVVDDNRAQRHMVSMQLRRWGYLVTESEDAASALRVCTMSEVDIIISDWMMHGMTGLELCRRFRALGRESYGYFVLLTSKSEKTEIADGLEAGADFRSNNPRGRRPPTRGENLVQGGCAVVRS